MLEQINSRRSVRQFKADTVDKKEINAILEAAMNAPSAGNEQAWQFIILTDDVLKKYEAINNNVPKGAPIGVLVCADKSKEKYAGYALQDCCAAIQNILLAVHSKKLGAVWTAIFPDKLDKINALIDYPDHIEPIAFIPMGQAANPSPPYKSRYDEKNVHWNNW